MVKKKLKDPTAELMKKLDGFSTNFAKGMAVTSTASIYNKGRKDISGTFLKYYTQAQYSAILDGKVCPWCEKLDGQILDTDSEEYLSGQYDPPQHKSCRCVWIYISKIENVLANWKITSDIVEEYLDNAHLKTLYSKGY